MATNTYRWVRNLNGATEPLVVPGKFQAGATQAIKRGELLEFTGDSNDAWVPLDGDFDMSAALGSGGKVAIAHTEIASGDAAGFYEVICPRPGDVFEFTLLSTDDQNPALGTAVYYSSSEQVTSTAGSNILGHVAGFPHYPYPQGHASKDAATDRGTTLGSVPGGKVHITIEESNSLYSALQGS